MLVMGGADITLSSFTATNNARVGVYLFDATGSVFETAYQGFITGSPTLQSNGEGSITGNQIGLNLMGTEGAIEAWLNVLANTTCTDNHGTLDG